MGKRLQADHSDMASKPAGHHPDPIPDVIAPVFADWFAEHMEKEGGPRPHAIEGLRYRASWTGTRCDRALYYQMADYPESNPSTMGDMWRMMLGSMIHSALEGPLAKRGWRDEVTVDLRPIGIDGSAHADFVSDDAVIEVKTLGGYSFKKKATEREPEGPQLGHVLQGAMSAKALGLPKVVIEYISLELVSKGKAAIAKLDDIDRFVAQWTYNVEDLEPIIEFETGRIRRISASVDAGIVAAPLLSDAEYPAGATVVDPMHNDFGGRWEVRQGGVMQQSGTTWMCAYCRFRDTCSSEAR